MLDSKQSIFAQKIEITKITVEHDGDLSRILYLRDGTCICGSEENIGKIISVGFDDVIHVARRVGGGTKDDPVRFTHSFFELDGRFIAEHSEGIDWSFSTGSIS